MADKVGLYRDLADQIDGMLTGETDITANLANAAAPRAAFAELGRVLPVARNSIGAGPISGPASPCAHPNGQGCV
ncbi:MAG: hypothetical protein QOG25_169, partial [Acetobacteraceae bacterium]|nr:hypothetical protein [Acetobacteraceae bacterium]